MAGRVAPGGDPDAVLGDVDAVQPGFAAGRVVGGQSAEPAEVVAGRARLLLGDSAPGEVDLAARFLLVFAPQVVLYGIGIVLAGVLQAHRRFTAPALAPLLALLG